MTIICMKDRIQEQILKHYGKKLRRIQKLEGGFRNSCYRADTDSASFVFIIYKKERGIQKTIENAHLAAKFLKDKGFNTRVPILTKDKGEVKRILLDEEYRYCALYNFLEGETIPWEAYTRRHLKSIGKTLSDMHATLLLAQNSKLITQNLQKWSIITKREIYDMQKYLKEVEPWIEKKLEVNLDWTNIEEVFNSVMKRFAKSDQQKAILHYDFVRGNILFSSKLDKKLDIYPIIGILDFEKVCIGPVIADVARTLAFLIVDCKYKKEETVKKRFMISGYDKGGKNKLDIKCINSPLMVHLLSFFWLRDFWKFLENNPYEYLHMNEHYLRTRDLLAKYGLILQ